MLMLASPCLTHLSPGVKEEAVAVPHGSHRSDLLASQGMREQRTEGEGETGIWSWQHNTELL